MKFSQHKCEKCGMIYGCWCPREHPNHGPKFDCGCKPVELNPLQGHSLNGIGSGKRTAAALTYKIRN
jgi:hypothetical protein